VNQTLNKSGLFDAIFLTDQNKRNQKKIQNPTDNQESKKIQKPRAYVSRTSQKSNQENLKTKTRSDKPDGGL
jgi:hypothetical protein